MARMTILFGSLRNSLVARTLSILTCVVVPSACSDGNSNENDPSQTQPALDQLSLSLPASLALGRTATAKATATYTDGSTADVSDRVTWSSDATGVLSVADDSGQKGVLRAVGIGIASVQASLDGKSASVSLSVGAAEVDSIAISPNINRVAKGLFVLLSAQGTYSDGTQADISQAVAWSVSDSNVATIGLNDSGQAAVFGLAPGQVTLHGQLGQLSADVSFEVTAPVLSSVGITGADPLIAVGATQQLAADGTYSDGSTGDLTPQGEWSSSDNSIATVGNSAGQKGLVTGIASGTATITVVIGDQTVSHAVTVY